MVGGLENLLGNMSKLVSTKEKKKKKNGASKSEEKKWKKDREREYGRKKWKMRRKMKNCRRREKFGSMRTRTREYSWLNKRKWEQMKAIGMKIFSNLYSPPSRPSSI